MVHEQSLTWFCRGQQTGSIAAEPRRARSGAQDRPSFWGQGSWCCA